MAMKYRVDRANSLQVPCGMTSIRAFTNNWEHAKSVYDALAPHFDAWDKRNYTYGLLLSVWDEEKRDYVIKCSKGFS